MGFGETIVLLFVAFVFIGLFFRIFYNSRLDGSMVRSVYLLFAKERKQMRIVKIVTTAKEFSRKQA